MSDSTPRTKESGITAEERAFLENYVASRVGRIPELVGRLLAQGDALRETLETIEQEDGCGESPAPVIVARVRRIASAALDGLK